MGSNIEQVDGRFFTEERAEELIKWSGGTAVYEDGKVVGIDIVTATETLHAKPGDYIIWSIDKSRWYIRTLTPPLNSRKIHSS